VQTLLLLLTIAVMLHGTGNTRCFFVISLTCPCVAWLAVDIDQGFIDICCLRTTVLSVRRRDAVAGWRLELPSYSCSCV
jgi:hypothetical protein